MKPRQRNWFIGELIKAEVLSQCFLAVGGKQVLMTPYTEKDRGKVDAIVVALRASDDLWAELKTNNPQVRDKCRTQLEVKVERWHLNYSNTPGGGWAVVEWLVAQGYGVMLEADAEAVHVHAAEAGAMEQTHAHSKTMAEAACRLLLALKAPEALR
jgi:hypothetical protein